MSQPSNRTPGAPPGSPRPGAPAARRRGRWERYRVTRPFSTRDLAGLWGSIAGVVALAALLGWALDMKGGVVIVVAVPFLVSWFESRRTAFQFDAAGVRIGDLLLPWPDVTEFVVVTSPDGPHTLIGARLRSGAALPPGAGNRQHPAMPAPVHVAVQRSKFDLSKMVRKSQRYAPPHIRIVIADPPGERVAA